MAIPTIELLKGFLNVNLFTTEQLAWKVGIQMIFVVSGVLVVLMSGLGESK